MSPPCGKINDVTTVFAGLFLWPVREPYNRKVGHKAPAIWVTPAPLSQTCRPPELREFCVMTAKDGKPCNKCGANEWYKNGKCAPCSRKYAREYGRKHREERKERARKWREENKEHVKEYNRKYREEHRGYFVEYSRKWREDNPEWAKKNNRKWHEENREYHLERCREWHRKNQSHAQEYARKYYRKNRKKRKEIYRKWYRDNREYNRRRLRRWRKRNPHKVTASINRRRARRIKADGEFTAEEFERLCKKYKNICLCCGKGNVRLTADHIVPLSRGGSNDISNIQPLCGPCNSSKGTEIKNYRRNKND